MNEIIKVSIIIPVYNCESYLEECFGSILNQTLKEIEVIAVNDGSTDNSLNLLKQIADKDSRVRIIDQKNKGGGIARNVAIKQAQGEYIGFVDADDWIDPNYYECLYLNAKQSNADLARTTFLCHHPDMIEEKPQSKLVQERYSKGERLGKNDHAFSAFDAIYTRELLQENGVYFDVTPSGHDKIFAVKSMFYAKKIMPVVGTYYHHRHHSSSQLHVFNVRRLKNAYYSNKHIMDFINSIDYIETGDYLLCAMKLFRGANWYFNLAVNDQNINKKDIRKFFAGMKYVYKHCKYKDDLFQTYQDQFLHVLRKLSFRHYYAFCKNQEVMTLRMFLGKARQKIIRILLGRELFHNLSNLNQLNQLNDNIVYLRDTMNASMERINQKLSDVENTSVQVVREAIEPVRESVQVIKDTITPINESVQIIRETINPVIESVQIIRDMMASVNESVKEIRSTIAPVKESVQVIRDTITPVNESVKEIRSTIAPIKESVQGIMERVKPINESVKVIRSSIQPLKDTVRKSSDKVLNALIRTTPKATLTTVVVSLVEHCNLNCWGCDHYAPLADKTFLDLAEFEKDMKRLAELSKEKTVGTIKLMGGEPLLHPDICEFTKTTRRFFPESRIEITTNGILLLNREDDFWTNCRENNIAIVATKYPLNIDWEKIEEKGKKERVLFEFYGTTGTVQKTSYHAPFDITGTQDTTKNFIQCFHANNCRELYHGHLYTCTIIPHAKHFNKAFNQKLNECEADSVDIHTVNDMEEILQYLAKPKPFCRYCDVSARTFGNPWQQSNKEIGEWVVQ